MKPATTTLADRLVQARNDRGLSQEDVAKRVSMTQQSYSDLERGSSRRTTRIGSLAHALRVDAYWLETGLGAPEPGVGEESAFYQAATAEDKALMGFVLELPEEKKRALLALLG